MSDPVNEQEDAPVTDPRTFTLLRYPEKLIVASLPPGADVPEWAESASLFAIVATATETTVVCAGRSAPKKVVKEGPFTAFAVEGPLDFALTGVLHQILAPLAEAQISVFTLSTYPTDWILVPIGLAEKTAEEWRRRGHRVTVAPVAAPRKK